MMVLRYQRDVIHSFNEEAVGYSAQRRICRIHTTEQISEAHSQRSSKLLSKKENMF